jgi:hypothetical protein
MIPVHCAAFNRVHSAIIFKSNVSILLRNNPYTDIVPSDITIELATRDDCFLMDIVHLILEVKSNNQVVDKVNLLSRESTPGVWDADTILVL